MAHAIIFAADILALSREETRHAGLRWGRPEDVELLSATGVDPSWLRVIDERTPFVVAEEDGRIVGFDVFLTRERIRQYSWLVLRPRPGHDVLAASAFVVPDRRGNAISSELKRFAARRLASEGYRRMLILVEARNQPSIRAQARLGARRLETLRRARIGEVNLVWRGGALPHIGRRPAVLAL